MLRLIFKTISKIVRETSIFNPTGTADCEQSRLHSSGINIPLISAPNPTRFFAWINIEVIMQFFLLRSKSSFVRLYIEIALWVVVLE